VSGGGGQSSNVQRSSSKDHSSPFIISGRALFYYPWELGTGLRIASIWTCSGYTTISGFLCISRRGKQYSKSLVLPNGSRLRWSSNDSQARTECRTLVYAPPASLGSSIVLWCGMRDRQHIYCELVVAETSCHNKKHESGLPKSQMSIFNIKSRTDAYLDSKGLRR